MGDLGIHSVTAVLPVLPLAQSLLLILVVIGISVLGALSILFKPRFWKELILLFWSQKTSLALLALLALGAYGAVKTVRVFRKSSLPDGLKDRDAYDWEHRGGLKRTGTLDDSTGPATGEIVWTAGQDYQFFSSPALAGNSVINLGNRWDESRFFCWDQSTGKLNWSARLRGFRQTLSSPVVFGNLLVCGEGIHSTTDARVVCLSLLPSEEGKLLWSWKTSGHVECTPVIVQGKVYFNAGDDGVYCLQLDPEIPESERLLWHVPGTIATDAETSLAVHAGYVFVGWGEGGNALSVLDALTGKELHLIETKYPVFGLPAIHENKIVFGTGTGNLLESGPNSLGEVICLDIPSMQKLWTFKTPDAVMGAVAVTEDHFIFGSADGTLFQLDHQGNEHARWTAPARLVASPAIAKNGIYIASGDGIVTGLTHKNLSPFWQSRIGKPGVYVSSPVIANGHLYVGTPENGFICTGRAVREEKVYSTGAQGSPWSDRSSIPSTGTHLWSFNEILEKNIGGHLSPIAVSNSEIILQVEAEQQSEIICLENRADAAPSLRWRKRLPIQHETSIVLSETHLFALANSDSTTGRLVSIDLKSGKVDWERMLDGEGPSSLSLTDEQILLGHPNGMLSCFTTENQLVWSKPVGKVKHSLCAADSILVGTSSSPSELFALDLGTGAELWRVPVSAPPIAAPTNYNDQILLSTSKGVQLHSLEDGGILINESNDIPILEGTAISIDQDVYRYVSSSKRLTEYQWMRQKSQNTGLSDFELLQYLSGEHSILVQNGETIFRRSDSSAEAKWTAWDQNALDGRIVSPMVLFDSRIYFITDDGALHCLGAATHHE